MITTIYNNGVLPMRERVASENHKISKSVLPRREGRRNGSSLKHAQSTEIRPTQAGRPLQRIFRQARPKHRRGPQNGFQKCPWAAEAPKRPDPGIILFKSIIKKITLEIWIFIVHLNFGLLWVSLGLSGPLWASLWASLWSFLGLSGLLRAFLGLSGPF